MTKALTVLSLLGLVLGCGSPSTKGAATVPPADRASVLARADAADGAADHVVSKCAVCSLGMEGSPEHVASFEGYTLHFCSAECRETFERNPDAILARLARSAP